MPAETVDQAGVVSNTQNNAAAASDALDLNKCPVYKCMAKFSTNFELHAHYEKSHEDLKNLGVSLG